MRETKAANEFRADFQDLQPHDEKKGAVMNDFFDGVAVIVEQARAYVGRTAGLAVCVTYFKSGA